MAKKKVTKKSATARQVLSALKGPKVGDEVSLKVIGYGLISYELSTIERVKGNTVWIDGRESQPVKYPEGRGEDNLGLRVDVVFDGGIAAHSLFAMDDRA